jgi:hypothetical protein
VKTLILGLSTVLLTTSINAAEVDQFTSKGQSLIDASEVVNHRANEVVKSTLKNLQGCNEKELYKALRKQFGNHINGEFTKFVIKDPSVPRLNIPIDESIYKDWTSFTGFILGNPLYRKSGIALSDLVQIGEVQIGTDKFEHLFGRGYKYFSDHYLKNKTIEKTLKYGVNQEKFILGGLFIETGVFSYADLSANFNGMRFWNHFLLKEDDILGANFNLGPYVVCENNQWKQNALIDFRNYFDLSMDESVNCSKFSVKKSVEIVNSELKKLNLSCPADVTIFSDFEQKYGSFAKYILNKNGNGKVKYKSEYGVYGE